MGVPLRVLVIEDSENDTLLLVRELRRGGYDPVYERVETAADMVAALEEDQWDLVISDHSMPQFSSSAALELLRSKDFPDLPFIIVSGQIGEDVAVAAMKAGAQDYIMKDNLARLNSAIERELREAEVRRKRRQAEEALQQNEQRFRSMIQYASDVVVVLDSNGVITYESPAVERILGYRPEERVGHRAIDLIHPDDVKRVSDVFADYVDRPGLHPTVEYRERARDGSWRCFEGVGNNLLDEPSVRGIVVNARDVTERKRAEENYRGIFENAVEGIFQSTVDGGLLTANPAMARILGYTSPEELLQCVTDVAGQLYVRTEDRDDFRRSLEAQGVISGFETRMRRKDESEVLVSLSARVLRNSEGEPVGFEGMMEDITERKRAEEALREIREFERNRIARELHDVVLQDLSYTLQSMQVGQRLAVDGQGDENRARQIESLRNAVDGLREAIYDLRNEEVHQQTVLRSVESLVELNRRMTPERTIELDVEDGFPRSLAGENSIEVVRIIQECLVNARRHSQATKVTVALAGKGDSLLIEVQDNGVGFDPASAGGMGIKGIRERAAALDGDLELEATEGVGARVRVRFSLSAVGYRSIYYAKIHTT